MRVPIVGASALAFLALAGCNSSTESQVASSENALSDAAAMTGDALSNAAQDVSEAVTPTPSGQELADRLAKSDAYEIAAAKMAKEKATSPDIKSFADMMIKDHTASTAKVKSAAAEANITPDAALTGELQGKLDDLNARSGTDFDKEYVDQQVDAHEDALSLLKDYADNGDVASLKTTAGEIATVVQGHLAKIRGIEEKR